MSNKNHIEFEKTLHEIEYSPGEAIPELLGSGYTPILTPMQIDRMAFNADPTNNRFGVEPTNKKLAKYYRDIFDNAYRGLAPENFDEIRKMWAAEVGKEQLMYQMTRDVVHMQNLIALGWEPGDLSVYNTNQSVVNNTIGRIQKEYQYAESSVIDICEFVKLMDDSTAHDAKKSKNKPIRKRNLNPVYITLVSGQKQAISSSLIRWWTKGPFCHACIGFKHTLDDMKSFNTAQYNGLSDETLDFYTPEERVAVYTIFVEDEDLQALHRTLDYYIDNRDKGTYSRLNIASIVLNVPLNFQFDMVCSQFVDRILKFAKIDLTGKDSSLVSPNDFWKASQNNKKMYKVYDGKVKDYKPNKVKKAIDRLLKSNRTKSIKECVEYLLEWKAEYQRPYTRGEIETYYGKETLDRLMEDPAHRWRADTGIELIHPEPTKKELERIWKNWNAMTPEQKKVSDTKCKELFNKTNSRLYYDLRDMYRMGLIKEECEYAEAIKENFLRSQDNIELNIEDWTSHKQQLLYITGLSGAGKSTLMDKLGKTGSYELITADAVTLKQVKGKDAVKKGLPVHPLIDEYFETHPCTRATRWETPETREVFRDFHDWLIQRIARSDYRDKQFIIEGFQIFAFLDPDKMIGKPLIIMGTSMITSLYRRQKRDMRRPGEEDWFLHNIRIFLRLGKSFKGHIHHEKELQQFINGLEIDSDEISESVEIIDYIPLFPVVETKEFPVQFDKEGNLLIKNLKKIDFNKEYQESHEVLKTYEKSDNIEGIKYELSKLWFLNTLLLTKIHDDKIDESDKGEYKKIRAWIMNDFNKYLKAVTNKEPSFNFSKYYEDSPFSDVRIKVNSHTIKGVADLIKHIVL